MAALLLYVCGWSIGDTQPSRSNRIETSLNRTGEWRQGVAGGSVSLEWSYDGMRLLVMERGAQGLRAHLLGADLADKGALIPVELVWTPMGASWSDNGQWVLVWGSVGGGNDILLAWNATSRDGTGNPLPPSSELGLPRIDAATLLANGKILAVAGRDVNGTARLRVYEVDPFRLHRDHALPGNASVLAMRLVEPYLVCVGSSGAVVVYESREWTQDWSEYVVKGSPTAWCIGQGPWTLVADGAGHMAYIAVHEHYVPHNATADGPVRGVAFAPGDRGFHVVAVGEASASSELQVWAVGPKRPHVLTAVPASGTVTWAVGHPTNDDQVVVAMLDGTIRSYRLETTIIPAPEPSALYAWLPVLWIPFFALLGAAAVFWWRDRRAAAAERPEEPERLRPRLSHRRR
jgi:hypothetical protein